jgi:hypothetical protein
MAIYGYDPYDPYRRRGISGVLQSMGALPGIVMDGAGGSLPSKQSLGFSPPALPQSPGGTPASESTPFEPMLPAPDKGTLARPLPAGAAGTRTTKRKQGFGGTTGSLGG